MPGADPIFDTTLIRRRLARAISQGHADFLLARTADDMLERLATVQRSFTTIGDVGTPAPYLTEALARRWPNARVARVAPHAGGVSVAPHLIGDPEHLPLASGRFDLIVSALALQTTNDLPGALIQIRHALEPDGLFIGAIVGGRTLHELRSVLTEAEASICGGASPRVAPFADIRDMGSLLQRAGFALPVTDSEDVTVRYDSLFALMADLRAMGATNALVGRTRRPTRRQVFLKAAALYSERFSDVDKRIRATFEIVSISGWAPHESQQKPAKRGSGQVSLAAILGKTKD